MDEYYDDYSADDLEELYKKYPRDKWFKQAQKDLLTFFKKNKDKTFYLGQLQVYFEDDFYHWVTYHALSELEGDLIESKEVKVGRKILKFYYYTGLGRYVLRDYINPIVKTHKIFSNNIVSKQCGRQAEALFKMGLRAEGFDVVGENVNKYRGKIWKETGHDLDFILERDGIAWGVEVKNTYPYMPTDEMENKLKMCKYLGIKPLFILRMAAGCHLYKLINKGYGGYCMIFKKKIFAPGHEEFIDAVRDVYPHSEVAYEPFEKPIEIFMKWYKSSILKKRK